jgi:hypothetical protein
MKMTASLLIGLAVVSAYGADLNIRTITATTAVENASVPSAIPMRWYQGESVTFRHFSTQAGAAAVWTNLSNLVAVWTVTANKEESPDDTNAYLYATGTVTAASGLVTFNVSPSETAMPASNYWSYVTIYQTDGTGLTNQFIGVVNRAALYVGERDLHPVYAGPWPMPDNGGVDTVARASASLSSNLASSALSTAQSNTAGAAAGLTALQAEADTFQSVVTRGGTVTSGDVTIDAANARTNTYGGHTANMAARLQQSGCAATGPGGSTALGESSTASGLSGATALGSFTTASGLSGATALGSFTTASGGFGATALGFYAIAEHNSSFVWSYGVPNPYGSHGDGTFNINPIGGLSAFYVGETNFATFLSGYVKTTDTNGWETGSHAGLVTTNAPAWIAQTNNMASITLTNDLERPQYLSATGAISLAFANLRPPQPLYLVIRGPTSITFQAGVHIVGGGNLQTNMSNHFLVWQTGTNIFVNPITASEN